MLKKRRRKKKKKKKKPQQINYRWALDLTKTNIYAQRYLSVRLPNKDYENHRRVENQFCLCWVFTVEHSLLWLQRLAQLLCGVWDLTSLTRD